jgi:hypothetical protein
LLRLIRPLLSRVQVVDLIERVCEPIDRLFGFATRTLGVERVWVEVVRAGASGISRSTKPNAASNFLMWRLARIIRSATEVFTSWVGIHPTNDPDGELQRSSEQVGFGACFLISMPG